MLHLGIVLKKESLYANKENANKEFMWIKRKWWQ